MLAPSLDALLQLGADRQQGLEFGTLVAVQRAEDVFPGRYFALIWVAQAKRVMHSFNLSRPLRTQLLTVPSGVVSCDARSWWVSPSKNASSST